MAQRKSPRKKPSAGGPLIVGVGGSAGAVNPLLSLIQALHADLPLALIVALHRDVDLPSHLAEVLGRHSALPLVDVLHDMRIEAGRIYVVPTAQEATVVNGAFRLAPPPARHWNSIDALLTSLAVDQGEHAVGVLLSGSNSDGTAGLAAMKEAEGVTFCQDLTSAAFATMPQSALTAGVVDFILSPPDIARELEALAQAPDKLSLGSRNAARALFDKEMLEQIFELLRARRSVDFSVYKRTTTARRILRRLSLLGMADLRGYLEHLKQNPKEVAALYDDLLIKVTSFFRESEVFPVLARTFYPKLFSSGEEAAIRVWVAGCSSGEQAYSIAIALLDYMYAQQVSRPLQIFATDVTEEGLARARLGRYPSSIARDVSPDLLARYFTPQDNHYLVARFVREKCVFARQNVINDPPFSHLDLIVCTNLLIYLETSAQGRVLSSFHYALRADGRLILGASESVGSRDHLFEPIDPRHRIFRKKPASPEIGFDVPPRPAESTESQEDGMPISPESQPADSAVRREVDRVMLNRFAPPGVVVDAEFDVVQYRGRTGRYLEPAAGPATHNVLKMAREGLEPELRDALHQARESGAAVRRENLRVRTNAHHEVVHVEVTPLLKDRLGGQFLLITFELAATETSGRRRAGKKSVEMAELRAQLGETREDLQAIIEEKEAANEELQAANEEIQSSNEELQSTNEEVQTAREELQSANEELRTMNEELQTRNAELNEVNDDLSNLLSNLTVPVLMLGQDVQIRRFTPAAQRVFNLIPTDVGRPLSDINPNLEMDELSAAVTEVLETLTPRDLRIHDRRGNWYAARVRPYLTSDKRIDGVVVALLELDELKQSVDKERETSALVDAILAFSEQMLLVLGADGRIIGVSQGVCRLLATERSHWLGAEVSALPVLGEVLDLPLREAADSRPPFTVSLANGRTLRVQTRMLRYGSREPRWLVSLEGVD